MSEGNAENEWLEEEAEAGLTKYRAEDIVPFDHFENSSEYETCLEDCIIGLGATAMVYEVKLPEGKFALKKFHENYGQARFGEYSQENAVKKLTKEALLLNKLSHENVVKCVGYCVENPYFGVLLELCEGGSLQNLLFSRAMPLAMPLTTMINWASQIAHGMEFLTRQGYVHFDLKTDNVLVKEQVCLCNSRGPVCPKCGRCGLDSLILKLTASENRSHREAFESYAWLAPETSGGFIHTEASDVWAFGVVLYEILVRKEVLLSSVFAHLVYKRGKILRIDGNCPKEWKLIMKKCWQMDPSKRPTFRQLVQTLEAYGNQVKEKKILVEPSGINEKSKTNCLRKSPRSLRRLTPSFKYLDLRIRQMVVNEYVESTPRQPGCSVDAFPEDTLNSQLYLAVLDYVATSEDQLDLKKRDFVEPIFDYSYIENGWLKGKKDGKIGMFPENAIIQVPRHEMLRNYCSNVITTGSKTCLRDCQIGCGATAMVYKMKLETREIALKVFLSNYGQERFGNYSLKNAANKLIKEALLLNGLSHGNVVQLVGYCIEDPYFGLLMELCQGGSLRNLCYIVHNKGICLQLTTMINWASQIAKGMEFLTRQGYVHRDLKADNSSGKNKFTYKILASVLVKEKVCFCNSSGPVCPKCGLCGLDSLTLKMTDFGETRRQETVSTKHLVGTYGFMAPEMYQYHRYTEASDVWAFGVVLWEILNGKPPIRKEADPQVLTFQIAQNGQMLPIDANCPKEWRVIMEKCWEKDPAKRPKFSEIVKYFENYLVLANDMDTAVQPMTLGVE